MTDLVQLKLSGTLLGILVDNAHIPGYPTNVDPELVDSDDPDRELHAATARWYSIATTQRVGHGTRHVAPVAPRDASEILNYLSSAAGALATGDADARREARRIEAGLAGAVAYLRRNGPGVKVVSDGMFTTYTVLGGES